MKIKLALATLVVPVVLPVVLTTVVTLHPGVAFARTPLARLVPAEIPTGAYTVDPMHTSVGFEIEHLGVSKVQGRFDKTAGALRVDPKNLAASNIAVTIATESVDTAVAPRDAHLRTPDFFDAAKYPELTFRSTRIRRAGKGYVAEGDLTIKATTKRVAIPFTAYGPVQDPWGNTRLGIVSSPITIDRQAYGIAYNEKLPTGVPAVGNEVKIRFSMEATLDKAPAK